MLRISRVLYDEITAHCRHAYPKEACGLLAAASGELSSEERCAVQVHPMTNVEDSPIGYSMDPKEQLCVEKLMRQRHQQLIGIYHSHTATDAYPSSVDVGLAISPDLSYVLISLKSRERPVIKSYRIDGRVVTLEELACDGPTAGLQRPGAGSGSQV